MITYTLLVVIAVASFYCLQNESLKQKYMFHPYSVNHNKEHYRFLSSAFIHGDLVHLGFNCLALWSFGLSLESYFQYSFGEIIGKIYYILLYTLGIYASHIFIYKKHKNDSYYYSLGASGTISAVVFCSIMINPVGKMYIYFIPMYNWIAGLLILVVSYLLIIRKQKGLHRDNIGHEAHFFGALFGVIFIIAVKPGIVINFYEQIKNSLGMF